MSRYYFHQRVADKKNPAGLTVTKKRKLPKGDFRITNYSWPDVVLWFMDSDKFTANERQSVYLAFITRTILAQQGVWSMDLESKLLKQLGVYTAELKAELQNTLEDVGRLSKDHKTLIKQRDALCKALKDCRDTLVLCALIDKSGQAQKSALLAEQALKGGVK